MKNEADPNNKGRIILPPETQVREGRQLNDGSHISTPWELNRRKWHDGLLPAEDVIATQRAFRTSKPEE